MGTPCYRRAVCPSPSMNSRREPYTSPAQAALGRYLQAPTNKQGKEKATIQKQTGRGKRYFTALNKRNPSATQPLGEKNRNNPTQMHMIINLAPDSHQDAQTIFFGLVTELPKNLGSKKRSKTFSFNVKYSYYQNNRKKQPSCYFVLKQLCCSISFKFEVS